METDHVPTGMTIVFGQHDLEHAMFLLRQMGFIGAEVWIDHIAPLKPTAAYAKAVNAFANGLQMRVIALNAIGHESFHPHDGGASLKSTAAHLADQLILADHLGASKVLIWDGVRNPRMSLAQHDKNLITVIQLAREYCGLVNPPSISVEFHPFTYALAEGHQEEVADALLSVDSGICMDFCHFGVSLGETWIEKISPRVLQAVNHIHYSDSDCETSELHYPPGAGKLDLALLADRLSGTKLTATWDLYGWPSPMTSYGKHFSAYRSFLQAVQGKTTGEDLS